MKQKLSIVIPVFNEEGNVLPLYAEIKHMCSGLIDSRVISSFEVIFIDDGSSDHTVHLLESLKKREKDNLKLVEFRKNFGQTAALKAGFEVATGDLIATMDGDLQQDPADIPRLIRKMDEGYDVVSGWRVKRKDKFTKRFFSKKMNQLRKKVIGDNLHDYGCSLKLYKKECVKDLQLSGELHRYITAYLHVKGYKIGELPVNHRPRRSGITKYKFNRGVNGVLDLFFLKFWSGFSDKPLHFFGRLGVYQWVIAILIVLEQIIKAVLVGKLVFGPLIALASMLVITGLLFIIFGFLSEILSKIYFKEERRYSIKKIL